MSSSLKLSIFILFAILLTNSILFAQTGNEPFTVEYYYKIKWGSANEFIELWKKNHYPMMKKAQEKDDVLSIEAVKPMMHSGEDTRWDFKVTVVYKNAALGLEHSTIDQYKKQLYPDLDKLAKEEQYRFTLLIAHWDVITEKVVLK
jgi:hypothetical protein